MIDLQTKFTGRYRLERYRPEIGEVIERTGWINNLVTDNGLDLMYDDFYMTVCAVGSASSTPSFSDITLGNLMASAQSPATSLSKVTSGTPKYTATTRTFTFAQGAVVGNVAEVGVGPTSTSLFSRALIKDGAGNPTTITVLSDEVLRVIYEFRLYIPETDVSGTVDINGTAYSWTARASNIAAPDIWVANDRGMKLDNSSIYAYAAKAASGSISDMNNAPSGTLEIRDSLSRSGYSMGSHSASGTIKFGISRANYGGGIGAIFFASNFGAVAYQIGFTPKIPKTENDKFEIAVSHSWARV